MDPPEPESPVMDADERPEPEPHAEVVEEGTAPEPDVAAVMSASGITSVEEASSYLRAARGQVELAVVRAHRDRRQRERDARERSAGADDGEALGRIPSADLPPLKRTVSSFVGRALVWVDCLFATELMLPPPPLPSGNAVRDALGNYVFVTLSVDGVSQDTHAVRRSCRPEWHAAFPFVVMRHKPFWLSATVSSLDSRALAAGGTLVTAHAQATSSFGVELLATIDGEAPFKQACIGQLHLAARKLRSKPAADVQSVLQLTTRPGTPEGPQEEESPPEAQQEANAELSDEMTEALLQLMAMGFDDVRQCTKAVQVADGNVETAVMLILNNDIPPTPKPQQEVDLGPDLDLGAELDLGDGLDLGADLDLGDGLDLGDDLDLHVGDGLDLGDDLNLFREDSEDLEEEREEAHEARRGAPNAPKLPAARRAGGGNPRQKWKQDGVRWVKVPAAPYVPLLQQAGFRPIWRVSRGDEADQLFWWVLLPCDVQAGSVKFQLRRYRVAQDPESNWSDFNGTAVHMPQTRWWHSPPWSKGNSEYEIRCVVEGILFCDGMREPVQWAEGEPQDASAVIDTSESYGPAAIDQGTMLRRGLSTPVGSRSVTASAVGGGYIESRWDAPGSYLHHGRWRFRALQLAPQVVAAEVGRLCEPEVELLVRQRSQAQVAEPGAPDFPAQPFMPAVFLEAFKCVPCGTMVFDVRRAHKLTNCGHQVCRTCLVDAALNAAQGCISASQAPCPQQPCANTSWLTAATARELLSPTDYECWIEACLAEFTKSEEQAGALVRCPECMLTFTTFSPTIAEATPTNSDKNNTTVDASAVAYATSLLLDAPELFRGLKSREPPERKVMDAMGEMRVLSSAEKAHFESNRFRCPDCATNFCRECDLVPYHTGFTCLGYQLAENQRKCRFCEVGLTEINLAQSPPAECLQDCCTSEECLTKRDQCCRVTLKCGHPCFGLCSDGDKHPPCLECGERNVNPSTKTGRAPACCPESHKLAFLEERNTGWACDGDDHEDGCLSGFTDHAGEADVDSSHGRPVYRCADCDYDLCERCFDRACDPTIAAHIDIPSATECCFICTAPLSTAPILQLSCGHIWHADCLKEIVEEGRQQNMKKLGFDYMKCPLCLAEMDHPYLEFEEKGDNALKKACEIAAMEQFDRNRQEGEVEAERRGMTPLQYAMFHYEFAPCKQCKLPFFVRAHDCGADAAVEHGDGVVADPPVAMGGDALCGTCRESRGGVVTCKIHGKDSIMWKCRYCCSMATYECFGYFHACDDCHPYEELQHLMDFSHQVKADVGDAKRGGVDSTAFPEVYPNKKEICDYDQCPGPAVCPLGAAHARTGFEHCFGCTQCAAEKLTRELDLVLVEVLRKASGDGSYLSARTDPGQMDDLTLRLAHYLWRGGPQLATSGMYTKKQIVHSLQVVLSGEESEPKLLELGVKGDVAAVAKGRTKEQLGEAVGQWIENMASSEREDLLRRTRVAVSVVAPVELPPQTLAAGNVEVAERSEPFEVKLRAAVSYRELRDVDMQLANPLEPNDPAADDGNKIVIASTTPNNWAHKLGHLVMEAAGENGDLELLELVPLAISAAELEPEPEPGHEHKPESELAYEDSTEQISTYETSLLLDQPHLFRGCNINGPTPQAALTPLETILGACRVGPVGDSGLMVAKCRWMAARAESIREPGPEQEQEPESSENQ